MLEARWKNATGMLLDAGRMMMKEEDDLGVVVQNILISIFIY
jgi:hypothetical protein